MHKHRQTHRKIALFADYRTRLVSYVVTGKLDVRGVVVPKYEAVKDVSVDESVEGTENKEAEET